MLHHVRTPFVRTGGRTSTDMAYPTAASDVDYPYQQSRSALQSSSSQPFNRLQLQNVSTDAQATQSNSISHSNRFPLPDWDLTVHDSVELDAREQWDALWEADAVALMDELEGDGEHGASEMVANLSAYNTENERVKTEDERWFLENYMASQSADAGTGD
jgi:hypothetical protein